MSTGGNGNADNDNGYKSKFIIDINNTKLSKKLSKLIGKGLERSVYLNEHLANSENKNTTNNYWYFLKSNFAGVDTKFVLVHSNEND